MFENSPSNIPRPKLESHASSTLQSETGNSTLSASRQKQSKRDEVGSWFLTIPWGAKLNTLPGHSKEDGGRPEQKEGKCSTS